MRHRDSFVIWDKHKDISHLEFVTITEIISTCGSLTKTLIVLNVTETPDLLDRQCATYLSTEPTVLKSYRCGLIHLQTVTMEAIKYGIRFKMLTVSPVEPNISNDNTHSSYECYH